MRFYEVTGYQVMETLRRAQGRTVWQRARGRLWVWLLRAMGWEK
jgi:hypothetical protein